MAGNSANPNEATTESMDDILNSMKRSAPSALLETARHVVDQKTARSKYLDGAAEERLPKVDMNDLSVGRVIGKGGFCTVYDVKGFGGDDDEKTIVSRASQAFSKVFKMKRKPSTRSRSSVARMRSEGSDWETEFEIDDQEVKIDMNQELKMPTRGQKYVVKRLSTDGVDRITFLKGTVDLAMETRYLAILKHENIVTLYGVGADGPFREGYFLILEKMKETLTKRMKRWMDVDRQVKGVTSILPGTKAKKLKLKGDKVQVGHDIARGVAFLHHKKIIYRDLKPDNIGFNSKGILKLFDFGLAREVRKRERSKGGLYKMTGFTGAPRFMAPEVSMQQPYNLSADVYSWSMVMWFIMALEPPFGLYTEEMIIDEVHKRGFRPKLFSHWSDRLVELIDRSWSEDWKVRPTCKEIMMVMKAEMMAIDPNREYMFF